MMKKFLVLSGIIAALSIMALSTSYAAENITPANKTKNAAKKVISYPAKVVQESVTVTAEAGKNTAGVVAKEVERVGEVATGDVAKTKELVTEPITGTAETVGKAAEGTVNVPVAAAKE